MYYYIYLVMLKLFILKKSLFKVVSINSNLINRSVCLHINRCLFKFSLSLDLGLDLEIQIYTWFQMVSSSVHIICTLLVETQRGISGVCKCSFSRLHSEERSKSKLQLKYSSTKGK